MQVTMGKWKLMFPFETRFVQTFSAEQGDAMKAHLAMTDH